jgi:hypothetical protein
MRKERGSVYAKWNISVCPGVLFLWPLCCLFFFDLRILITSLWYLQTLLKVLGTINPKILKWSQYLILTHSIVAREPLHHQWRFCLAYVHSIYGRKRFLKVTPKTIKLVFVASPLSTQLNV